MDLRSFSQALLNIQLNESYLQVLKRFPQEIPGKEGGPIQLGSSGTSYLVCRAESFQQEAEAVAGPLVVLQTLS